MRLSNIVKLTLLALLLSACATVQTTQPGELDITRAQHIHPYLVGEVHSVAARQYRQIITNASARWALDRNHDQVARARRISQALVTHTVVFRSDAPSWQWEMHVITGNEVNAWCMPGGKMVVYSGFIERLQPTDDELAAVIGHEMAHALRLHAVERISQQLSRGILLSLGAKALGLDRTQAQIADLVSQLTFTLPNSRMHEREADRIGVELAARAGFDPTGAVSIHRKMGRVAGVGAPEWLSTHPTSATRIKDVAKATEQVAHLYRRSRPRPMASPVLQEPSDGGWAAEPFEQSRRGDVSYTPMERTSKHSELNDVDSQVSTSPNVTDIQVDEVLQLFRQRGLAVDTLANSHFRITADDGFFFDIQADSRGEYTLRKSLIFANDSAADAVIQLVNNLNDLYPTLDFNVSLDSPTSPQVLHIKSRIPASASNFERVLFRGVRKLREAYFETLSTKLVDETRESRKPRSLD